jgi:chorismate synthase
MSANTFGQLFAVTNFGESHGVAIGCVIDGCPPGLPLSEADIQPDLDRRRPGTSRFVTQRQEADLVQILSGVFEGKTTGTPISIIIHNHDADSSKYDALKDVLRPGHANFTYLQKYGDVFDHRGGGRASARETACRVAAAAVAKKILQHAGIHTCAYISEIGNIHATLTLTDAPTVQEVTYTSPIYCPDPLAAVAMMAALDTAKNTGDSLGGVVNFLATGLPEGLGDPIYEKLEANLAKAMLSMPASKGFEIGEGFFASRMKGSAHNDAFCKNDNRIHTTTNHAGGTLGGISTGMPLVGRVAFKPTSSIAKPQPTLDRQGHAALMQLPEGSRHDPCLAIRAVPVVDAMCALVLVDALLLNRCARL